MTVIVMNGNKALVNVVSLKTVFWEVFSHVFVDVCVCSPTAETQSERARAHLLTVTSLPLGLVSVSVEWVS